MELFIGIVSFIAFLGAFGYGILEMNKHPLKKGK